MALVENGAGSGETQVKGSEPSQQITALRSHPASGAQLNCNSANKKPPRAGFFIGCTAQHRWTGLLGQGALKPVALK